jgi:hypothetical protein
MCLKTAVATERRGCVDGEADVDNTDHFGEGVIAKFFVEATIGAEQTLSRRRTMARCSRPARSRSANRCHTTTSTTMCRGYWTTSCPRSAGNADCRAGPGRPKRSNGGKQRWGKNSVGWQFVRQHRRLYRSNVERQFANTGTRYRATRQCAR